MWSPWDVQSEQEPVVKDLLRRSQADTFGAAVLRVTARDTGPVVPVGMAAEAQYARIAGANYLRGLDRGPFVDELAEQWGKLPADTHHHFHADHCSVTSSVGGSSSRASNRPPQSGIGPMMGSSEFTIEERWP